jgi:PBP1b-binding outer membrane lipoprotein LpoB
MKKTYVTILAAVAAAALTAGCEQQQPGPAEKVGKQIDQAVEKAGQKTQAPLEKAEQKAAAAAEKVEKYTDEKMKEAGKAVEQAGEKLQK